MRGRRFTFAAVLLGVLVLGGWRLSAPSPNDSGSVTAPSPIAATPIPPSPPTPAVRTEPERVEAPIAGDKVGKTPVDVEARERFNERARAYFADAAQMTAEDRVSEAQQLEQELTRLEQAGGMSAGETLLIRAGLIRETVPSGAERDAKLQALQQRYKSETQLRLAAAQARPDPAFESYKVREREIVNEVMAMHTIPDGLSRDEYLRQRLQGAREQLTP